MKEINITTSFKQFDSITELPKEIQDLMQEAITIRKNAYAPYSNFRVGAALLLENNKVVCGSNQENAAYPSGLCAERVAIFYAGANYPGVRINKMAITAAYYSSFGHQPYYRTYPSVRRLQTIHSRI